MNDTQTKYAGFWIRLIAELIDSLLLTLASVVLEVILVGAYYWIRTLILSRQGLTIGPILEEVNAFKLQIINSLLYIAVAVPYYVTAHYRYGTTLGKKPLGIRVVNEADLAPITLTQSWSRCLGYAASYLFGVGFLMAAFHPKKRALHDLIAGTVSIKT